MQALSQKRIAAFAAQTQHAALEGLNKPLVGQLSDLPLDSPRIAAQHARYTCMYAGCMCVSHNLPTYLCS